MDGPCNSRLFVCVGVGLYGSCACWEMGGGDYDMDEWMLLLLFGVFFIRV